MTVDLNIYQIMPEMSSGELESHLESLTENELKGIFMGFPICCINYWCGVYDSLEYDEDGYIVDDDFEHLGDKKDRIYPNHAIDCLGIVPCPKHQEETQYDMTSLTEEIAENRIAVFQFPDDREIVCVGKTYVMHRIMKHYYPNTI